MQRGCANNNMNLSILLYASTLSFLIQFLNRLLSTSIVVHVLQPYQKCRHSHDISNCMRLIGFAATFDVGIKDESTDNGDATNDTNETEHRSYVTQRQLSV